MKDGLLEMGEDMRFHYISSYTPRNRTDDGRFREVSVEVRRRGLEVRTRHGYFAMPPTVLRPLPDPKAKALAALELTPPPSHFPLFAAALSFPTDGPEGLVPVFLEVPGDRFELAVGSDGSLRGDVTFVARIRDEEGRLFARLGQRFRPNAPLPTGKDVQTGGLLCHPLVRLPAGRFVLEAAAYDAVADKTSVRVQPFRGPEKEAAARLSSLVVAKAIRRLDPLPEEEPDPLVFGDSLLQPNLGETVHKSETPSLAFFVVAQGRERLPEEAVVEVWGEGTRVGRSAMKLEPPDPEGTVRQGGSVSLASLRPGLYTLKVEVASGEGPARAEASFSLAE